MTGWSAPEGAEPAQPAPTAQSAATPASTMPPGPQPGMPNGAGYGYGMPPLAPAPAAPRPGIIPLRPLGLGEILDGSFTTIRTTPIATLGIAAIVMLVNQALFLLCNYTFLQPKTRTTFDGSAVTDQADAAARVGAIYIVTALLTSIELLVLTGVIAAIVGDRVVGKRVRLADARAKLRPVAWPLVRVVVVVTFIVAGTVAVCLAPGIAVSAAGSESGGPALVGVGFLLMIVPLMYAWTTLSLAPAVVVLERQGARAALRRSRRLVHGAWWRVFWISLLELVISWVVSAILSLPFLAFGGGLSRILGNNSSNLSFTNLLMSALGGFVGGTLARPFQSGVSALLYVDRRMRAEGLDLALQRAASTDPT